jgi:carbon storage regulator
MSNLVFSRQHKQRIHIGDDIVVTVVEIRGDKVRLAIDAPRSIVVHRGEIYDEIKQAQEGNDDAIPTDDPALRDSVAAADDLAGAGD